VIDQATLRALLHYDPATGVFTWLVSRNNFVRPGSPAGYIAASGYRRIQVNGHEYPASHLVWLYVTGRFPSKDIDHADLVKDNNRFYNLREATVAQNNANVKVRPDNKAGFKGVRRWEGRKWQARIRVSGRLRSLGYFDTPEAASQAYAAAALEAYGEFARA
jgi:hypothetical protein